MKLEIHPTRESAHRAAIRFVSLNSDIGDQAVIRDTGFGSYDVIINQETVAKFFYN